MTVKSFTPDIVIMPPPAAPAPDTPSRPARWARRKDFRPAELLEAGLTMFAERGFAATRLEDVARAAVVSKGTLYLYYPSKQELFKAVVRNSIVDWLERVRSDADDKHQTRLAVLRGFLQEFWQRVMDPRLASILKIVVAESTNFPEMTRFFEQEVVAPHLGWMTQLITTGIESGEFPPIDAEVHARLWIAPPVLKAIWSRSFETASTEPLRVPLQALIDAHLGMVTATLQIGPPAAKAR